MKLKTVFSFTCSVLFLTGCQATPVVEGNDTGQPSGSVPPQTQVQNQASTPRLPPVTSASASLDQIDYLSGQMTTMQEQVIKIKADTSDLKKNLQIATSRIQMLNSQQTASASGQAYPAVDPGTLEQLNSRLSQVIDESEGNFRLASGYTSKGQWVLIRYDRFSGQSWLADQGSWNVLNESGELSQSVYTIELQRADKDVKGYVAARVDQQSGETWWLKQDTWMKFQ